MSFLCTHSNDLIRKVTIEVEELRTAILFCRQKYSGVLSAMQNDSGKCFAYASTIVDYVRLNYDYKKKIQHEVKVGKPMP